VRSDEDALLSGLLEYFSAWHTPAVQPEWWVSCESNAGRYAELGRRLAPLSSRTRPVFVLDTETVHQPTWWLDGATVAFDERCECYYLLAEDRITVLTHPGAARARLGLLRVVRELICSAARSDTRLDLHAAAVEIDGRGVVACGPKRTGKSSLLCQLLSSGQARYVANDRVRIVEHDTALIARGIPTVVRLRPLTLDTFPALRAKVAAPPASGGADSPAAPAAAVDVSVTPARLCALLGAAACLEAPLAVVLHPRIVPEGPAWSLRELSRREALASLSAAIYGQARTEPTVFEARLAPWAPLNATEQAEAIADLASRVPQYLCALGPGAYAESPAALVADVQALCRGT